MPRTLDFADHRRDLGDNRYVYAVVSRRARGLSIGINLNVDKVCNFDCPYCQVDRTGTDHAAPGGGGVAGGPPPRPKSPQIDLDTLEAELSRLLGWVADGSLWEHPPFHTVTPELRRVADIAFAGDGEPTTPAAFPGAVERVRAVRARFGLDGAPASPARSRGELGAGSVPTAQAPGPAVPIRLLTNATMLHRERVKAALPGIDEVWAKLDAGTEAWFRKVDGTTFPFSRVLSNLAETAAYLEKHGHPIVIQSMFCALDGVGPDDAEIDAWLARLDAVAAAGRIHQVQIYTVARKPAETTVGPLPRARLDAIGARVRARGLVADVYGPA